MAQTYAMVSKGRAALSGVVAAAVALGVAEVVAALTGPQSAPLIAVGGVVVDSVPEPVKQFAISLFGVYDKIALLVGTGILLALFAALIGIGASRDRRWGYAGIAVFAAIGVAAALTRHNAAWLCGPADPRSAAPPPCSCCSASWTSRDSPARPPSRATRARMPRPRPAAARWWGLAGGGGKGKPARVDGSGATQRRSFLGWALGTAAVAVVAGLGGRWLSSRRTAELARKEVVLPPPSSPAPALPANIDPPVREPGAST